jgi:hypothetical protein
VQSRGCTAKATGTPSVDDFYTRGGMHVYMVYIDGDNSPVIWCTGHQSATRTLQIQQMVIVYGW